MYCVHRCYAPNATTMDRYEVPCDHDGSAQEYGEFYDLETDVSQKWNLKLSMKPEAEEMYDSKLIELAECVGQRECNSARMKPMTLDSVELDTAAMSLLVAVQDEAIKTDQRFVWSLDGNIRSIMFIAAMLVFLFGVLYQRYQRKGGDSYITLNGMDTA